MVLRLPKIVRIFHLSFIVFLSLVFNTCFALDETDQSDVDLRSFPETNQSKGSCGRNGSLFHAYHLKISIVGLDLFSSDEITNAIDIDKQTFPRIVSEKMETGDLQFKVINGHNITDNLNIHFMLAGFTGINQNNDEHRSNFEILGLASTSVCTYRIRASSSNANLSPESHFSDFLKVLKSNVP